MIAARQIFLGRGGAKLPYDAEVEYLESTGTQYIKVGQIIGATKVTARLAATEIPSSGCFKAFGVGYSINFGDDCGISSDGWFGSSLAPVQIGVFADVECTSSNRVVDSTSVGFTSKAMINGANAGKNLFMFCGTEGTNPYITSSGNYMAWRGRISSLKVFSESGLIRDIIAVRFTNELGQSEGAMYDRVSGQLFRNSGTGTFLYGADKTDWVNPYVTDGLVAMWDGEWNAGGGVHDANATSWVDLSNNGHHLQSSDFRWIDNALDDTASNIRMDLGNLSSSFPSSITMESAVRCPNFRNNAFVFDFYNHSDAGCTMFTSSLSSPFTSRCQVRNGNSNSNSQYSACDSNYNITTSLVWGGTEERYRVYFFGESIGNGGSVQFITPPIYFVLGASNNTYQNFRGYVYSLRLYNRALTAAEIAANYAIDKERFNLP